MCAYSCLVLSLLELWLSHGDVGLGQEIPMWKAVALLRIPLAGRPALTGQSGICRKEETGQLMHLVIPLIRLLKAFKGMERKRKKEKKGDRERNTIFSQRGTRAQHSWHCHWPPNNPYSILCVLGEWMATVCEAHRRTANVAGALRAPDPAKPPSPAAKSNTGMSETALLSHRTGPTSAENTLQKINRPGPRRANIWWIWERQQKKKRMNV